MKVLFGLGFLFLINVVCVGQDKPLPYDERGKLIHYEVVEVKDIPKDSLVARANHFFKKNAKTIKLKSAKGDTLLQADGKLIIKKTALVLSRPSGEIQYGFYMEAKDGKYRFWLTDFEFIPYQRDRYGNFVAATTVGTPLENKPGKLNAAQWQAYEKATAKEAKSVADNFKEAMIAKVTPEPAAKTEQIISTKKW